MTSVAGSSGGCWSSEGSTMSKNAIPMKVFTQAWHEAGCPITKEIREYGAYWEKNEERLPSAYKGRGLGWHDMELQDVRFVEGCDARQDLQLELYYGSLTSSFRDVLVFKNADVRKNNVKVGNLWLYDEVEIMPDGKYFIRIVFYGGGEKRRYIKVVCDDVIRLEA